MQLDVQLVQSHFLVNGQILKSPDKETTSYTKIVQLESIVPFHFFSLTFVRLSY